jgi:hypothetical protein
MDVEGGDGRRRGPDGKESEMSKRGFVGWSSVVALVASWAVAGGAGSAWAGEYHVYGCRMPDGQVAPTDGWSGSASGAAVHAEDKCAKGGALVAELGEGVSHAVGTDIATWMFSGLPTEPVTKMTLWRAGDAEGGSALNATYQFWAAGPTAPETFDECIYSVGCTKVRGEPEEPLSLSNILAVPAKNLGEHLYINASCGGLQTYKCPSGKGDTDGYAAVVYLYASDLVLQQSSQPSISGVEGELATASTLAGTSDLAFHAEDPGSGVYQAVFTIDGSEVGRTVLGENGGHCHDVGQTTDGLPAFLYLQPCAPSLTVDLPFDTTMLTDGTHHLVVSATNASGNSTVALDRKVTIANHPSVTPPQQTPTQQQSSSEGQGPADATKNDPSSHTNPVPQLGSANGTNASAGATLHVRWSSTAKASLAASYGHAQTVLGHLLAPSGASIVGASIQVLSTPSFQGAHPVALASARTASDGSFRVRLPSATPSSRLTFAYSSHLGQPSPDVLATLALTVPAHLSLRVTPRTSHAGGRIAFIGMLSGSPLPPGGKQIVLEARTPTGPWRQFRVLSTVAHGRYHATYRFRLAGPILYEFRAVSRREADFPYATGASGSVRVHEH